MLAHFYIVVYILDMTPCESFLLAKNGSSKLKQLVLIAFLLLGYLYIVSYHPSNLASSKMAEILSKTQLVRKLLTIEKKITTYNHHKEFLHNYKVNRKYPKGLGLKFNLSLCSDLPDLQKTCRSILRNASFQLRDNIIQTITEKLQQFSFIRKQSYNILKENISSKFSSNLRKFATQSKEKRNHHLPQS